MRGDTLRSTCRLRPALCVLFLLGGVARASPDALEAALRKVIADAGLRGAQVAVAVVSDTGRAVVSIESDKPLKPASNQKVLTTAAALHWLGPDYAFETLLVASAPLRDGTIAGDVTLRGGADPNISGRFFGGDTTALLRDWSRRLREAGLRRIQGDLIADDTLFDDVRFPEAWDPRQAEAWYSAQVSALSINDNCLDVTVRPASVPGRPARVEISPRCPLIEVVGAPETVIAGKSQVIVHRRAGTNQIVISGRIAFRAPPWSGNVTIDDPAMVFGSTLAETLREAGIQLEGRVRKAQRNRAAPDGADRTGKAPGRTVLVRHTSTLLEDLPVIQKRSQNLHAEMLLRLMGARAAGEGSARGGAEAILKFLEKKGIPAEGLVVSDGSGLSHENRVTAVLLARVLHSVRSEKHFAPYFESLPVAGKDGTLERRFQPPSPLHGTLHAKTGYIRQVSCLSGYIVKGERIWSFAVLVNGLSEGTAPAKRLQEKILERVHAAM